VTSSKGAEAERARQEEETLRQRWEATQSTLRERFDEPISKATNLTRKTLAWFPIRVWRHFLLSNGFLLAAGVSYQALFAVFAAIYVAFAAVGLWLGGSPDAVQGLIDVINSYLPGLISEDGAITPAQIQQIVSENTGVLGVTGLIALGALIWTAIGWVTFARRAVRDIFGLPFDLRSYVVLKARDLLAATIFGAALVLGVALSSAGALALNNILNLFGVNAPAGVVGTVQVSSILVSFAINSAAMAGLFRFLSGAQLEWRVIWPGSLLAGGALTVLQLGAGLLIGYTPSDALLATFAIFIGLLLWFRLNGIVMLVGAAWIAVRASDEKIPLLHKSEADRRREEHAALLLAAHVRLRTAQEALDDAPWFRKWRAERAVQQAQHELAEVESAAPAPATHGLWPPETVPGQN
jgi:membrane protein